MTYSKLLVATDLSEEANAALRSACELADRDDAELTLLHVIDLSALLPTGPIFMPPKKEELLREEVRTRVTRALQHLRQTEIPTGLLCETVVEESESVPDTICEFANAHGHEAIIVGTHGRSGFSHLLIGSVAERVIRKSEVPVMVVPISH